MGMEREKTQDRFYKRLLQRPILGKTQFSRNLKPGVVVLRSQHLEDQGRRIAESRGRIVLHIETLCKTRKQGLGLGSVVKSAMQPGELELGFPETPNISQGGT